jgi:hypothetical protein
MNKAKEHPYGQGQGACLSGQSGCSIYMSRAFTPTDQTNTDLRDYLDACENGTFYEELAYTWKMACSTKAERNRVKRSWCYLTFGKHRPDSLRWKRYSDRWPTCAAFLEGLKAPDYKAVARFLQRLESDLMIRGVADHLRLHYPHIPLITVHDSVLTTEAHLATVQSVILTTWSAINGKPMLKSG